MSSIYNISATQGSTLLLNLYAKDSNNNYLNLNGYSSRGFVKYQYSNTGYLLNLNPTIHNSYISGLIQISGRASDIANLIVGEFVYDIEVSGANEYVFKPIMGKFTVNPECTI